MRYAKSERKAKAVKCIMYNVDYEMKWNNDCNNVPYISLRHTERFHSSLCNILVQPKDVDALALTLPKD